MDTVSESSINEVLKKIEIVVDHIKSVQRNTHKLGSKLIAQGDIELGRNLIANGLVHDNSKLRGIEFEHLFYGDPMLDDARRHHVSVNPHHPEHWGDIHNMPSVYVAEMVCDWYARSSEFGTDFKKWITSEATERFGFSVGDSIHDQIIQFVSLLLSNSFGPTGR
jgi:hypothetical protein